jgi:hypothetical protein
MRHVLGVDSDLNFCSQLSRDNVLVRWLGLSDIALATGTYHTQYVGSLASRQYYTRRTTVA